MKVLEETKDKFPNNDKYGTYHTTYKCPKCGCTIHLDWHEKRNYCPECGVKLEFSQKMPKLTNEEKAFLKILINNNFHWIVFESCSYYTFECEPIEVEGYSNYVNSSDFDDEGYNICDYIHTIFDYSKFENHKLYNIKELLKGGE